MGSEGVAEHMGGKGFGDARPHCPSPENFPKSLPGQGSSPTRDKYGFGYSVLEQGWSGLLAIGVEALPLPKLFKIYLSFGAKVCSAPVIDRFFKTIDFLMIFDLDDLDERNYRFFFDFIENEDDKSNS